MYFYRTKRNNVDPQLKREAAEKKKKKKKRQEYMSINLQQDQEQDGS